MFAVNLERWAAVKAAPRIEKLVRLQNSCPGGLAACPWHLLEIDLVSPET